MKYTPVAAVTVAVMLFIVGILVGRLTKTCAVGGFRVSGTNMFPELLHESPTVVLWHNFLSSQECDELIQLGKSQLRRSTVQGITHELSPSRTSYTTNFTKGQSATIRTIEKRVAGMCQFPAENIEPFQLVRYMPGQFYKHHYDFFVPGEESSVVALKRGGQRTVTLFVYLNDVPEGGETDFPKLHLRVKPTRGAAVLWYNMTLDGKEDFQTFHAGLPPKNATKFGLNIWIRQRAFK